MNIFERHINTVKTKEKVLDDFLNENLSFTNQEELKSFFKNCEDLILKLYPIAESQIKPIFNDIEELIENKKVFFRKGKFNQDKFRVIMQSIKNAIQDSIYTGNEENED